MGYGEKPVDLICRYTEALISIPEVCWSSGWMVFCGPREAPGQSLCTAGGRFAGTDKVVRMAAGAA